MGPIPTRRPILLPPWDDAPIDRPRARAVRWRRLLAGRAGNTRLQPGSCCGCNSISCPNCSGITLPTTLHVTETYQVFGGTPTTLFSGLAATYGVLSALIPHGGGLIGSGWVASYAGVTIGTVCPGCSVPCGQTCSCSATFTLYTAITCQTGGFNLDQYVLATSSCPTDSGTTLITAAGTGQLSYAVNQCNPVSVVASGAPPTTAYQCNTCSGTQGMTVNLTVSP